MRIGFFVLAASLSAATSPRLVADTLQLRCSVREPTEPVEQRREFQPPAEGAVLDGGFVATATTSEVRGGRRVDVTVADATGTEREIVIDFGLRLAGEWTHVFVTDGRGPQPLTRAGSARYRSACSLPALTLYGPETGLTVASVFEVPAPGLTFSWSKSAGGAELTATVSNLRLPSSGRARAGFLIGRHEGCWRPGLGWLVKLYPDYFDPPNSKVWDYDGPMIYDFITSEDRLRRDLTQDLTWQELGWYWPHLGLYLPEGESWKRQPRSEGGLGEGGTVAREMVNEYLALSDRLGVGQCLYFQSTEAWAEYAQQRFPECRIRRENGDLVPTWVKCAVMDPDPDGRFGQHILDQLRGLVNAFAGMAGVFWDQNCYTGFDFAHDDGISMVKGRRVSMMEFPQNRMFALGSKLLRDRGKVIFTNGGWTVGLARYCDGHMSEGTRPTRRLQYICMKKHLTLLAYDHTLQQGREKLRLALETGAQPCVTLGDDSCRALFEGYRPIFRLLRRKEWVFHPRALTLPEGIVGNIFRNGEGNYVVTAVLDETRTVSPAEQEQPAIVEVRVPDANEIACVFELNPQRRGLQAVQSRRERDGYTASLGRPEGGAALLLARRGRWIGSGTPQLIAGRPQPLDVVVANLAAESWRGQWRFSVGAREVSRTLHIPGFQVQNVQLGPVSARQDETMVSVHVSGPSQDDPTWATTIDIPVALPLGLHVPSEDVVQVLRGETVAYAITNRLAEEVTVAVRTHWEGTEGTSEPARETLKPGATKALTAKADPPRAGLWELRIEAEWPGGRLSRSVRVDVVEAVLPKGFTVEDVVGLTLRMDVFNSLGGQWADKLVKTNGVRAGQLPLTGSTLKWHDGLPLEVPGEAARKMLNAGIRENGDIELAVSVDNGVKNCFKIRNVQVSVLAGSGEEYLSTCARAVHCSDAGWLYAEGQCVRLGEPMPLGTVMLIRER